MTPASLNPVSPGPVAVAPAPAPAPAAARGDDTLPGPGGFARQLEQQREQRHHQHTRSQLARQATARQDLQAAERQRAQATTAPAAGATRPAEAAAKDAQALDTRAETPDTDAPRHHDDEASAEPALVAVGATPRPADDPLIALALRRAAAGTPATEGEAGAAPESGDALAELATGPASGRRLPGGAAHAAAADRAHGQGGPRAAADFTPALQQAESALTASVTSASAAASATAMAPPAVDTPALVPTALAAAPAEAALRAADGAAGTTGEAPPATASAEVPVPVHQPGFGAALGQRLAVLARDGVQEARLSLHPADMGPVTVQIVLEGTAARIDFQAARSDTCGAIEQALPTLAGALREAGLTLAGGGVFQQGGGQGGRPGEGTAAGRGRSAARDDEAPAEAATAPLRARRGVVDLVA